MKTSSHHCAEKECNEYIDRDTSRYWCKQHEVERRERITKQLENAVKYMESNSVEIDH